MEILIIGTNTHLAEARQKFGEGHRYHTAANHQEAQQYFETCELVFDFVIEENPDEIYGDYPSLIIFLNTAFITLSQLNAPDLPCVVFGFCGLPTFLEREILELSLRNEDDRKKLITICNELNTKFEVVADRVGLVTPRVICMIINEAYYTVQEGTATREDIDLAMKLGTNYPWGPFEWCKRIGIKNVCQLLDAMHKDTRDERYKICELLKKESEKATQG